MYHSFYAAPHTTLNNKEFPFCRKPSNDQILRFLSFKRSLSPTKNRYFVSNKLNIHGVSDINIQKNKEKTCKFVYIGDRGSKQQFILSLDLQRRKYHTHSVGYGAKDNEWRLIQSLAFPQWLDLAFPLDK